MSATTPKSCRSRVAVNKGRGWKRVRIISREIARDRDTTKDVTRVVDNCCVVENGTTVPFFIPFFFFFLFQKDCTRGDR